MHARNFNLTARKFWHRLLPYNYLAPALLILGAFGLLPVLFTLLVSVFRWDAIQGTSSLRFAGLDNFVWIFMSDDWFGRTLSNTLWSTIVTGTLIHSTAIPLASFVDQNFRRWRATVMALYFLPYLTSGVVVYVIVATIFSGAQAGLANVVFNTLGNWQILGLRPLSLFFATEPVPWFREHGTAIWVMVGWWHELGWNVLLYVTALQYIPRALYEAARMDGANAWQTLRYVTVPQLRPMIFFAGSITLITGVSGDTLGRYLHYMAYIMGDYGATAAMAATILLILFGLLYVLWAYVGGRPELPRNSLIVRREHPLKTRIKALLGIAFEKIESVLRAPPSLDPHALRGFNGMRAIACLMVVIHHLAQRLDGEKALLWVFKPLWRLGLHFDMGVSLFFVLSGTLLSMPFWERFFSGESTPSIGQYAARRAARIVPGYWAALILSFAAGLIVMPEALFAVPRFLAGMSFVSGLHYTTLFPSELDPILWSISFEVMCYVLLPLLLLPAWRVVPSRHPQRALKYLIGVLILLQLAHLWVVASFMTEDIHRGWRYGLIGGAKEWIPYWNPATFMTQFMLGSLTAFGIVWKTRSAPRRSGDFDTMAVWALLAALFLVAMFGGGGHNSFTLQPYITPVFPGLCAAALFAMHFGRRVHLILDNRLFNFVATISFGLYLWHFPVIELLRLFYAPDFLPQTGIRNFAIWLFWSALVLTSSLMLAWLSWRFLEQPALLWVKRKLSTPRQGVMA